MFRRVDRLKQRHEAGTQSIARIETAIDLIDTAVMVLRRSDDGPSSARPMSPSATSKAA
jgi:hypothetical protein